MKLNGTLRRILSLLMAVAICFSVVPWAAFASEDVKTYTKVTSADQFTTGSYIMVVSTGYAPEAFENGWVLAVKPTVTGDTVTDELGGVWTITVDGTGAKLTDKNGVSIAPSGGNNNGIKAGDYSWAWAFANGTFTFSGTGADTVILASNTGSSNRFRAYKTSTASGNPNGYPTAFTLYKLAEQSGEAPTETTTPEETTTPVTTVVDIATALAASEGEFTVKGVVTLIDDLNYYVQDATGGICVRLASYSSEIALGDTIVGTGSRADYNGLPQLGSATYEKSEGLTLAPKQTTIGALTAADICTYVKLTGLTVTQVNGTTVTVSDGTDSIQIYKAVTGDTAVAVGDQMDFTGAVGVYQSTLQLRNTLASELVVTPAATPEPSEPDPSEPETPAGTVWTKVELADIQPTDTIAITMTKGEDTWALFNGNGTSAAPTAVVVSVNGETMTSETADTISWNISSDTDGLAIYVAGSTAKWLYSTNTNNGTRVGTNTNKYWVVDEASGYLKHVGTSRYLGVYTTNPDWRAYTNTTGNTAGQTLAFWKLGGAEPEDPWADVDAKYSIYQETTELSTGDVIVIYNPGYSKALSSQDAGYYKTGVDAAVTDGYIASDAEYIEWTVSVDENGVYTFTQGEELTLGIQVSGTYFNLKTDAGDTGFTVQETAEGSGLYYIYSSTLTGQYGNVYAEWYASKNAFSAYCTGTDRLNDNDFGFKFYKLVREGVEEEEPEVPDGVADGNYVIWAPAYNKALSSVYGGFYNNGVDLTVDGENVYGYGSTEIWTVTNNDDGTISLSYGGQKLGMADSYSSMTLGEKHDAWILEDAGNGTWYVKNVGRSAYIEWYASNKYWSGYGYINSGSEGMFALKFTPAEKGYDTETSVVESIAQWGGMPKPEDTASVNGDKYVVGDEMDTEDVYTAVVSGSVVIPWTKGGNADAPLYYMGGTGLGSGNDDYLQFAVNAAGWGDMELSFRLRASNSGPGSFQLKYSTDGGKTFHNFTTGSYAYAYTGWTSEGSYPVTGEGNVTDGIAKTSLAAANYVSFVFDVPSGAENCGNLIIRLVPGTDRANGSAGTISASGTVRIDSVFLSGSPIVDGSVTGFVTVAPNGEEDQPLGTELTMTTSTEGAVISYRVNGGEWLTYDPVNKPILEVLPCDIEVKATKEGLADSVIMNYHYAAGTVENVRMTPNGGGVFIEGESTEIKLATNTEGATIYFATSADGLTFTDYAVYTDPIVIEKGFGKLVVKAYAEKEGFTTSTEVERTFTERTKSGYDLYFGQLHSHTNISDGSGSVEEAFEHASNVKNLDFLAVTDHSNSFDGEGNGVLSEDGSAISSEWKQGHEAAAAITDEDFVGIYGFEMTWSNGLGHINTFNTPGWQSRTQSQFTNASTALQNYYATLATVDDSISQFNHPGTTFGDFSDFAHYSELSDSLITLIEVGNGEGAIGSSGYFPSYEYYTRALDKGWHVAPTNNQDNHKGLWGDANTGRTVVLADSLTEEGIYDALRNYRVYATEDNDLNIYYSLDGNIMGSQLSASDVGDTVTLTVNIGDYTDANIGLVEVIVNGGLSLAQQNVTGSSQTVTFEVSSNYNYYYIKITQPDGDIAVTAPVWVGKVEAVGISSLEVGSQLTIAGEEQTISMELYNNESKALEIESIVFTNKYSGEVLYTETGITSVPKESTASCSFGYTFANDGVYTVTATVKGTLNGVPKTYTKDLELNVMPAEIISRVIVDGTHYNDYVTGYYGGRMGNMTTIAANQGIQVHVETDKITAEMLAGCELLIISAPAKKSGTDNAGPYVVSEFEDEFIALVAEYVKNGGNVIVCGLADYQDKTNDGIHESSVQINKLLAAIGSTMSINDDEAYDEEKNGGQAYRLYPESFNMDSKWCEGMLVGQTYSQYSGCTVNPGSGTWLVKGFDSTYSIDSDGDGKGGVEKGQACFLAAEETPYGGTIFAAGGVFVSDFEVAAELDNIWDMPYANRTIYENIIGVTRAVPAVAPIAEVRASAEKELGRIFVIEGYVTAGTANADTKFFDAIYVQDETGGITVFPYSAEGLEIGTKMRITGYTDAYQGDIEIQILTYEILDEPKNIIAPEKLANKDAMDYAANGGELLQVEGVVTEVILTSDGKGVAQFVVKDDKGDLAKVFIDGYILSGTTGVNDLASIVKVGNTVQAAGLLYLHPEGESTESVAVLRVRDCDEVVLIKAADPKPGTGENVPTGDTSLIIPMLIVMTISLVALAVLVLKRKSNAEK